MKTLLFGLLLAGAIAGLSGCEEKVVVYHHHYYDEPSTTPYTTPGNPVPLKDEGAPESYPAVSQ